MGKYPGEIVQETEGKEKRHRAGGKQVGSVVAGRKPGAVATASPSTSWVLCS